MFNAETPLNDGEFHKFRKLIYEIAGISLSDRKRELVKSRLARRLRFYDLTSYGEYYDLLCDPKRSNGEIEHFINALTTNKTEFFRESHHFDYLRNTLFPALRQATLSGREKKVRIWCAASSTGQEPYTLAMTMLDYFGPSSDWDLRLLASDIDTQVLATASEGIYPESEMEGLSPALQKKHFIRESRGNDPTWRAKPELRKLITFRQLNLIEPNWPIRIQFDAIFCRNVMIYFDQSTQSKLVERFSEYLVPEGMLFIGHSESLFSISDQFDSLGDTIYKAKPSTTSQQRQKPVVRPVTNALKPAVTPNPTTTVPTKAATATAPTPPAAVPRGRTRVTNSTSNHQHMSPVPRSSKEVTSDQPLVLPNKVLVVGEYEASREECILQTALGSCVAACLFDPSQQLGGMNHFMLPEALDGEEHGSATYGVHAMELLINAIMKLGGNRRHLIAKIFGGARVVEGRSQSWDVGQRNVDFVKRFLDTEKIPIAAEHVLGDNGRRVKFIPTTGKVFVSLLDRLASISTEEEERADGRTAWLKSEKNKSPATIFSQLSEI